MKESTYFLKKHLFLIKNTKHTRKQKTCFTLAVITRLLTPAAQDIIKEIMLYLDTCMPGRFIVKAFDGKGNEHYLLNQVSTILDQQNTVYDAVISLGAVASQVCSRLSKMKRANLPIIFACLNSPASLGIVYPGGKSKSNICGIESPSHNYAKHLQILYSLKKDMKHVLIPFNPQGRGLLQESLYITNELMREGIQVTPLFIHTIEELVPKITPFLKRIDTILTLRDDIAMKGINNLAPLCNAYHITAYSSDLFSVQNGAAVGFANTENTLGQECGKLVYDIFYNDMNPEDLPVKKITLEYKIAINQENAHKQGLKLSTEQLKSEYPLILYGKEHSNEKNN